MSGFVFASQIAIALGLLGVWVLRTGGGTRWRGEGAVRLREEFLAYGLPPWFATVIASLELVLAVLLLTGLWWPVLAGPAALVVALVMLGALGMHFKVRDPMYKSVPAFVLLVLAVVVVASQAERLIRS
jgi:uncharacterized membrane protein YphA (DoxX/SURF4 family)